MAAGKTSVEIGFDGGQVIPARLDESQVKSLKKALGSGDSPHEIETDEGTLLIDLGKVIFVRISSDAKTVGF
ncbi:MAG TPA: hypothetical protein PKA56_00375 [Solirubrobacterales bacterium]|jgi:hypothetical protein|nr:hypothetical protein [Solirubrobacterales bacterium]HMU26799.1 hypothetical protein [Solirubrobacterales bacterium]HMX70189.1 hypothetical protein [Solirubrobacterales bacterium]HMY26678.1 hypothetical protein [Solirubrobacterales bacterium]HNA24947.1 hypothetical protein [Solirubrobacterales bacterium]